VCIVPGFDDADDVQPTLGDQLGNAGELVMDRAAVKHSDRQRIEVTMLKNSYKSTNTVNGQLVAVVNIRGASTDDDRDFRINKRYFQFRCTQTCAPSLQRRWRSNRRSCTAAWTLSSIAAWHRLLNDNSESRV